jgi:CHAD domain-containing protein
VTKRDLVFYDTFDWRLHKNRMTLCLDAGAGTLSVRDAGGREISMPFTESAPRVITVKKLPAGELKDALSPVTEPRAPLKIAEITVHTESRSVLNDDEKTVVRLAFETVFLRRKARRPKLLSRALRVTGMRGYIKDFERFTALAGAAGLGMPGRPADLFETAVRGAGREPGDYSSKVTLKMSPDWDAPRAASLALKELSKITRLNEKGAIEGTDNEFLHDFRVAVRKTRSAISRIKHVFPHDRIRPFAEGFARLGRLTNASRDSDVFLAEKESFLDRTPASLHGGLEVLFEDFESRRRHEMKKLAKDLKSHEHKRFMDDWERFLSEPPSGPALKNSETPVLTLARKHIFKLWRGVVRDGEAVTPETGDAEMHELRIVCKKLRYMLEFFGSLFPEDDMARLTERLKSLQDNLGAFNDACVQLRTLEEKLAGLSGSGNAGTAAAAGALMTILHEEKIHRRKEFSSVFAAFNNKVTAGVFRRLFGE